MQQKALTDTSLQTGRSRLLAACRCQEVDSTPIWFMRQAGRCLAEYQELRKKYQIVEMTKTPELCTQITLMPVQAWGVDGAVLYADIMLPLEAMGVSLEILQDGPLIHHPLRTRQDIENLRIPEQEEIAPYLMKAIDLVRQEVAGQQAVIGFSGAPFTLACYLIEGKPSRDYNTAKALMYGEPALWQMLMEKLSTMISRYLVAQIQAGADLVQLFDSWVGTLSPSTYRRFVLPFMQRIFTAVQQTGAPAIHFGTGTGALLEEMRDAGGDVISIDWRVDLDDAWRRIGYDRGIQGNLDPVLLLTDWPVLEAGMRDVLHRVERRPGHIFNLGHGIPAQTASDTLRRLVAAVHEETRR